MAEARPIPFFRPLGTSGIQFKVAGSGHDQYVAQVGMSRAAEVSVAETYDCLISILVSGAIFIGVFLISACYVVRHRVGVGAQLHESERSTCSGEGVPHAVGAYDWIYIISRAVFSGACI